MSIFPKDVQDKANAMGGMWLKGSDFENGLTVQIKSVEKVSSKYGATEDSKMVEKGILEEGETFRYVFFDSEGHERKMDSNSMPFFIGMQNAEINIEDWLKITREGKGEKTRYYVEKVTKPEAPAPTILPTSGLDPDAMPF